MKARMVFGLIILGLTLSSASGQELTLTVSPANSNGQRASIDLPGLTGNPLAIIVATPIGDTELLNPHPVAAWYYSGKWYLWNSDGTRMPVGAQYKIQFFQRPSPSQFLHVVTQQNLGAEGSYIDNPALNNNPSAQVKILQNHAPEVRPYNPNRFQAKAAYSTAAGRWYIANVNGEAIGRDAGYNIVVTSGETIAANTNPKTSPPQPSPNLPAPIPPPSTAAPTPMPLAAVSPAPVAPSTSAPLTPTPPTAAISPTPSSPVTTSAPTPTPSTAPKPPEPLYGFVDMHTHPVSQLGFGEQLFHGENDGDPSVALGACNCIHKTFTTGACHSQNLYRMQMVDKTNGPHTHVGYPSFADWPKYDAILHQQMWIDWIKRAKEGGLRVMVALAVNNHTLADAAETGGVNDDLASMNKQITRMKELFARHTDFLEIAFTSADLRRIVSAGKLAVIIGVEMDNIGNFYNPADPKGATYNPNPSEAQVRAEIDRLYDLGVRYIFPIHITNNLFGGTALYNSGFNVANKYNTGAPFVPEVVSNAGGITFVLEHPFQPLRQGVVANFFMFLTGPILPPHIMPDHVENYPFPPAPVPNVGHRNSLGLTPKGEAAIRYMMKKGMLIDIDHMSEKAVTAALSIATSYGYPLNSGHNGFRNINDIHGKIANENGRTNQQVQSIYSLGGMLGLGHGGSALTFLRSYRFGLTLTGNQPIAIGTDVNGFFPLPGPPASEGRITYGANFIKPSMGNKVWDFNDDGMAHYGMLPDFIESWKSVGMSASELNAFFSSAERFARMWEKCDTAKANVP